jgi:glycolate oxidase iron-sulfur subunit
MPAAIKKTIPLRNDIPTGTSLPAHARKVLLVQGCVQKSLQPAIDVAATRVLDAIGIQTINAASSGCCGALSHHLGDEDIALQQIRHNIDSWLPLLEQNDIEAITMTASGCGVMIRDYPHLLADDAEYAAKARRISEAYRDPIEIVSADGDHAIEQLKSGLKTGSNKPSVAFHPPCTLQHGQKITGQVEALLTALGYTLKPFANSHLCCGSAGTYSITQKHLSRKLLNNKISSIEAADTDMIITANIGCQTHLQSATEKPVCHWLELLV